MGTKVLLLVVGQAVHMDFIYRDYSKVSSYSAQAKRRQFDSLLGDNSIPCYVIEKGSPYTILGRAKERSVGFRVDNVIPKCLFRLDSGFELSNRFHAIEDVKSLPGYRPERKNIFKFIKEHNLTLIGGKLGDGILLTELESSAS